jgi:phage portal protein BeeE
MPDPSPSLLTRAWQWLTAAEAPLVIERSTGPLPIAEPDERRYVAGSDWVAGTATPPLYSPLQSLAGAKSNPFLWAALLKVSDAAASLPIVALRDRQTPEGVETTRVPSAALELLRQPSPGVTGLRLRRQLMLDLQASGNAVCIVLRAPGGAATMRRVHPGRVRIEPGSTGEPRAYLIGPSGEETYYDPADVIHIAMPTAEDGVYGLWGTGYVEVLRRDLLADEALAERARRNGATGRPAAVLAPKGDMGWDEVQRRAADIAVRAMMRANDGGVLTLSGDAELKPIGWAPKEQELPAQRTFLREQVMAVTGCPPTVMGLPGANFATAQQEAALFWGHVRDLCRLVDDALSRLPAMLGESPAVRLAHDFGGVPELQPDRTERLANVAAWVGLGADPDDAAAYEGFADAPALSTSDDSAAPPVSGAPADAAGGAPLSPDDAADLVAQARAVISAADPDDPDELDALTEAQDLARMVLDALDGEGA